jgi:glycosyltransferase involved in cell wall biosynthesis
MRILMVSKALVVATYRTKLRDLAALGVEVIACVPSSWKEAGEDLMFEPAADEGYQLIRTPIAWNGHYHLHYYPALSRVIRETKPDIIHLDEEPYNLSTYLAMRTGLAYRARCLFFTWQNISRKYPPPFTQMERYVYNRADYGLAGSQDALNILREKGYRGRAKVLPQFGVDVEQFRPVTNSGGRFTVGYLGRLVPEKGIGDLMAAFNRLDAPARLIIAGDGPMAAYVDSVGSNLKHQGRLERFPRVPSADVPALLRRLDVLVLPSRTTPRWKEQYGRILIEAMASGVAVVGSDSGEIPNVIGDAGIVIPEGSAAELAKTLERLADSEELRRDLAERGRRRSVEVFSQMSVARQTLEVYQEMLALP